MSAATIEVVPAGELEELLSETPPCEALRDQLKCGRPATARVTVTCPNCGPCRVFLCSSCLEAVQNGKAWCSRAPECGRRDLTWAQC